MERCLSNRVECLCWSYKKFNILKEDVLSYLTQGLSDAEVAYRTEAGQVNVNTQVQTRSFKQICLDNILTLFNGINFALAILVISTGHLRNVLFLAIVFANLFIGIYQEIRAKIAVDKLSLLTKAQVEVIRSGKHVFVNPEELVLGDLCSIGRGAQIPADSVVIRGHIDVSESLLTGESNSIRKMPGDELFSGSFVESGTCLIELVKVGSDSYVSRLNNEVKYVKGQSSEILTTINAIIKFSTIALIPIGLFLFVTSYFSSGSYSDAILSSVAAVLGMIPQGLVLLTSSVMALATIKLAKRKVLAQNLYCPEALARVSCVCLDKTGTITTGAMTVDSFVDPQGAPFVAGGFKSQRFYAGLDACIAAQSSDPNDTTRALMSARGDIDAGEITRSIAFSSQRKYAGVVVQDGTSYALGALVFMVSREKASVFASIFDQFEPHMRVLALCKVEGFDSEDKIQGQVEVLGFVLIEDEIRPNAFETIRYFYTQNVKVKIISGDDPKTVAAIAARAGIRGTDTYLDASKLTDEDLVAAASSCNIFGRVTPEQKRHLVHALQGAGHKVCMTGDGVNDILALKAADCSVAMAQGSEAARNISDIVLGDNDFSHLPHVVAEGRKSINNLTRSASLFLVKTVYSVFIGAFCIFFPPYPFIPIQMSLLSTAIIGVPSFILALEGNYQRVKGEFLKRVLLRSIPASISFFVATVIYIMLEHWHLISALTLSTMCFITLSVVGVWLIVRISVPLTPLRLSLLTFILVILIMGVFGYEDYFRFVQLGFIDAVITIAITALSVWLFNSLLNFATSKNPKVDRLYSAIERFFISSK